MYRKTTHFSNLFFGVFLDTATLTKPTMILQLGGGCFDFSCGTSFFSSPPQCLKKKLYLHQKKEEKQNKKKGKKRNNLDNYYPKIYIYIYMIPTDRCINGFSDHNACLLSNSPFFFPLPQWNFSLGQFCFF